ARKVIIKHGSEHVTVRRIAQEVGVSEGAIYRHFKSKRDVLSLLVDDIEKTLMADLNFNCREDSCTLEFLEMVIKNHMSHVVQRKGVSFQVIAEIISLGDKRLNEKVYGVITGYTGRIRELLGEGVKSGVLRPDIDLDAAAVSFFGITQGVVGTWALSQYGFNLEEKYESLWKLFREAIIKH
ncbi:MAG: TetR/AcrR family transcriptional regulator, partial [Dehalococcoidales bacterium]|nr:TetR/AcrR family transcriptional regulator [Dehalococcoidales bacterium]